MAIYHNDVKQEILNIMYLYIDGTHTIKCRHLS